MKDNCLNVLMRFQHVRGLFTLALCTVGRSSLSGRRARARYNRRMIPLIECNELECVLCGILPSRALTAPVALAHVCFSADGVFMVDQCISVNHVSDLARELEERESGLVLVRSWHRLS